ncbi:MAG: signal peptidase I [Lachnospiraceae bacterium]|nr:signal peptidase I [Lachnospiraceae bacterium]
MSTKKYKSSGTPDKQEEKNSIGKEILSWIEVFVIAAAIAFVINNFLIANSVVPTGSMEPNIMTGARVFGSRLTYLNSDPQRGDVVIFHWPDDEKVYFVKRVIGLPGETVDIIQGQVYINGEPLDEPYLAEPMYPGEEPMHFEVPENAYFMMGDNRNYSADARYWDNTYVYKDKIIAKVGLKYWPFPIEKVR